MAVTVGTGTSVYSQGATATINKPAGVSDGDLLVAVICSDTGYFSDVDAPAGWTLVTAASNDEGAFTAGNLKTFTRIVSGDGASYTFEHYDGAATAVTIVPIFGAGPTPTLTWVIDPNGTTETAPSVVAGGSSDALVCWIFIPHGASSTPNYTAPSGMTEVADTASTGWASMAAAKLTPVGSAGATGTKDFSVASITKGTPEVAVSLIVADPGGGATDYTKTPADAEGITDAPVVVQQGTRTQGDAAGITDTRTVVQTQTRTPADPVGATDAATSAQGFARTPADGLGITDSVTADFTGTVTRTQEDAVGLTDSVAVAVTVDRTPADTIGVTDTDSPLVLDVTEAVADPVGLTDAVTVVRTVTTAAADTLGITDSATAAGEGDEVATPADTVPLSDAATRMLDSIRTPADLLALTDTTATTTTATRGPADTAPISDSVVAVMERVVAVADTLAPTDAVVSDLVDPSAFHNITVSVTLAARTAGASLASRNRTATLEEQ